MSFKRKISYLIIGLVIAIIVSMVGITDVFGAEPGATTQTSDSQSQDGLQIEAKFYAERYGVTVDEAMRRFKIQDEARPLEAELTDNYAETFGGLWVQHTPEFRIVVAFTRDGEATINPYLQGDLADAIKINTVKYSYNSLYNTQVSLLDPLRQLSIKSDTYIDIMNNCVVVNITKPNQLLLEDALKNGKLIIPDSIKIVTVDALATPEVDVYGGLSLDSWYHIQTSGFGVKNSSGTKGITTAGHCDDFEYYIIPYDLNYQDGKCDTYYDIQWHTVFGLTVKNKIRWWSDGSTFDITAVQPRGNQLINEPVSKYGRTTHYTAGTIYSKDVTLWYVTNCQPTFIMVANSYGYNPLSAGGDSGGPWFRGNTAYGSHSGGDDSGYYAYYMAENYIGGLSGSVAVMTSP